MSTDAPVLTESRGRVGLITLNRPQQLNALNDELMDALGAALLAFDADEAIGAIVITGFVFPVAGEAFGFVGVMTALSLYAVLCFSLGRIARRAARKPEVRSGIGRSVR